MSKHRFASDAERVFVSLLVTNGSKIDRDLIEAECVEHPSLADDLRRLYAEHLHGAKICEELVDAKIACIGLDESSLRQSNDDYDCDQDGTVLDNYRLIRKLGEGGFGVVFLAEQLEPIRRKVAIKVIKAGMDTRQVIARFEVERQALALMEHANIAKVLDAGESQLGRPYFVMELVSGMPITEYCQSNGLIVRKRLELFLSVCDAVQHAHQKGIIHRDLKPNNILITLQGGEPIPKIIDFGIAKATHQRLTEKTLFTEFFQFIGTPEYMSPEQAEMSALDVDTRADIYALGVLLYELLTDSKPFDMQSILRQGLEEVKRVIREVDPPLPSTRVSTLAQSPTSTTMEPLALKKLLRGDLDWVIARAMDKDRTRRYETAREMAIDIRRHLDHQPVWASPPSARYRIGKFIRRNRLMIASASIVVLALLSGTALATFGMIRAGHERALALDAGAKADEHRKAALEAKRAAELEAKKAKVAELSEEKQKEAAQAAYRLALEEGQRADEKAERLRQSDYAYKLSLAHQAFQSSDLSLMKEYLDECPEDLRNWEWHYLNSSGPQILCDFKCPGATRYALHWEESKNEIAVATSRGAILVWDLASGQLKSEVSCAQWIPNEAVSLAWAHDGGLVAAAFPGGDIGVWDSQEGLQVKAWQCNASSENALVPSAICWDSDSTRLAVGTLEGFIVVSSVPDGEVLEILSPQSHSESIESPESAWANIDYDPLWEREAAITSMVWGPDGNHLAVGNFRGTLTIWNTLGEYSIERVSLDHHNRMISDLDWDPASESVVTAGVDQEIRTWNAKRGHWIKRRIQGHNQDAVAVDWSPDGLLLASASEDRTVRVWEAESGRQNWTLQNSSMTVGDLEWGPRQRLLACVGNARLVVWSLANGPRIIEEQSAKQGALTTVAWKPNSSSIAMVREGRVKVTPLDTMLKPFFVGPTIEGWPGLDWGEDPALLAVGSRGHLFVLDCDSTEIALESRLDGVGRPVSGDLEETGLTSWSPSGDRIAITHADGMGVAVVDALSGEIEADFRMHGGSVYGLEWHPSEPILAACGNGRAVQIWDLSGLSKPITIRSNASQLWDLVWSPEGNLLAASGWGHDIEIWDPNTGESVEVLRGHRSGVTSLSWRFDGKRLASIGNDQTLRIWNTETGFPVLVLATPHESYAEVAWSPNGEFIVTTDTKSGVYLWGAGRSNLHLSEEFWDVQRFQLSSDRRAATEHLSKMVAEFYDNEEKSVGNIMIMREVIAINKLLHRQNHEDVIKWEKILVMALVHSRQYREAEQQCRTRIELLQKDPEKLIDLVSYKRMLLESLLGQREYVEAKALALEALEHMNTSPELQNFPRREQLLRRRFKELLGDAMSHLGQFEAAEPLLLAACEQNDSVFMHSKRLRTQSLNRLTYLYLAWGNKSHAGQR